MEVEDVHSLCSTNSLAYILGMSMMICLTLLFYYKIYSHHLMTLNSPWYEYVRNSSKIYEGRRFSPKYNVGDTITFSHHIDKTRPTFNKCIVGIYRFETFEDALNCSQTHGCLNEVLPGVNTVHEGVEIYKRYVSLPTQYRDGVMLIKLAS